MLEEGWVILDNGGKGLNDGVIISVAALEPPGGGGDGNGALEESEEHRAEPSPHKEKGKEKDNRRRRSGDEGDADVGHNDGRDDLIDAGSNSAAERKAKERKEGAKAPKKGHKKGHKKKEHKEHKKEKKSKKAATATPRASRDVPAADIMPYYRGGVEGEAHREYDDLPELVAEFDDDDADRLGDAAAVSIEEGRKEKNSKKKEKEKEKEHDEFDIVFAQESEEEKKSEEEKGSAGLELLVPSPLAPGQHDPLAATDEDDELKKGAEHMDESFIERYLAQLVEPSPDRGAAKEERKEERACISCDRHFPVSSPVSGRALCACAYLPTPQV
jgi:hypothetical protein